jgi:hypothetical protein
VNGLIILSINVFQRANNLHAGYTLKNEYFLNCPEKVETTVYIFSAIRLGYKFLEIWQEEQFKGVY